MKNNWLLEKTDKAGKHLAKQREKERDRPKFKKKMR